MIDKWNVVATNNRNGDTHEFSIDSWGGVARFIQGAPVNGWIPESATEVAQRAAEGSGPIMACIEVDFTKPVVLVPMPNSRMDGVITITPVFSVSVPDVIIPDDTSGL